MGALTAKPYAFKARFWELTESAVFDPLDSFHSPLRLELRGGDVMRVLPDVRYLSVNEWISDRARFSYDALYANRNYFFAFFVDNTVVRLSSQIIHKIWVQSFFSRRSFLFPSVNFDFFGREQLLFFFEQNAFLGRFVHRTGLYDFSLPLHVDVSTVKRFPHTFFFGISLRTTHPVLYHQIRQIKSLCTTFEFGSPDFVSEYSVGSSFNFFVFFTLFRTRLSTLFHDSFFSCRIQFTRLFSIFSKDFLKPQH